MARATTNYFDKKYFNKKRTGADIAKLVISRAFIYLGMSVLAFVLVIPYLYMFLRAFIFSQMRICSFIGGTGINKASKLSEFRVAPLMAVLVFPF